MKKILLSIALLTVLLLPTNAFAQNIKIVVNNQEVQSDVAPYIENGRTMVPIRVITEYLGYNVSWYDINQSITITNDNPITGENESTIALQVGIPIIAIFNPETVTDCYYLVEAGLLSYEEAGEIMLNDSTGIALDTYPVIKNNRTFVPIRVVSEYMGLNVNWDNTTKTVNISNTKQEKSDPIQYQKSFSDMLDDISTPIEKSDVITSTNFPKDNSDLMGFIK